MKIDRLDGEICIRFTKNMGSSIAGDVANWEEMAQKYRSGEITHEEYDGWRYRYPRSEAERWEEMREKSKED